MIERKFFKICLGFSGLIALCALTFVLAQTDEATVSTSSNTYDGQDYQEMFSAGLNEILYVNWQEPKGTNLSADIEFFLGAYRFADGSLSIDLNRSSLSNDLYYAISYSLNSEGRATTSDQPSIALATEGRAALYFSLLATNGLSLIESEDLLSSTNVAHYVFISDGDIENPATNYVILAQIPTAEYPSAAIVQLSGCHSRESGNPVPSEIDSGNDSITILESLLLIDAGSDLWPTDGQGNGATNYPGGNSLSNFYAWVTDNTNGSSTNIPGGPPPPPPPPPPDGDEEELKGKIFIDQSRGSDSYTGRLPQAAAGNKGPKKTVRAGLSIAEPNDTIIIKSGNYNENLNISGKTGLKVKIEGKVRL